MAKYRKEFLIPYLRDISALHLAQHKLQERFDLLDEQRFASEKGKHTAPPQPPRYEASNGSFFLFMGGYTLFLALAIYIIYPNFFVYVCLFLGIIALLIGGIRYIQVTQENRKKELKYIQRLDHYQQAQDSLTQQPALPEIEKELSECGSEIQRVQEALEHVYRCGIIPEQYQNLDAAVFLYIWFESGKSNSLDMTFKILEDHKIQANLDQFIANKREHILKQYLRSAKHYRTQEQLKKHTAQLTSKVNHVTASDEERNFYLAMVESNTVTLTYFANTKYIGLI